MDTGSQATAHPATAIEETDILDVLEDFESIYDVPFITMNRIGGQYQAEIITSINNDELTKARIQEALDVGHAYGVHAYARIHGDYNNILIFFTPDQDGEA